LSCLDEGALRGMMDQMLLRIEDIDGKEEMQMGGELWRSGHDASCASSTFRS